jgi:hypothetical protein
MPELYCIVKITENYIDELRLFTSIHKAGKAFRDLVAQTDPSLTKTEKKDIEERGTYADDLNEEYVHFLSKTVE